MNRINFCSSAVAAAALIALGIPPASLAGTPEKAHKAVGSWLYTVTIPIDEKPENNIVFQGVETYLNGGSYIETDQLSFSPLSLSTPSHGSWAATGTPLEFLLTYFNFTYDREGNPQGKGRVRQTASLSEDGQSYTGSGDFTYFDNNGGVVLAGNFTVKAARIQVEAPESAAAVNSMPFLQRVKTQRNLHRVSR